MSLEPSNEIPPIVLGVYSLLAVSAFPVQVPADNAASTDSELLLFLKVTLVSSYPAVTVCIRWITMTCWSFISQRKQILPLRARICRRMRMSAVSESSV